MTPALSKTQKLAGRSIAQFHIRRPPIHSSTTVRLLATLTPLSLHAQAQLERGSGAEIELNMTLISYKNITPRFNSTLKVNRRIVWVEIPSNIKYLS